MKISLSWLRDFIDCQLPPEELEAVLRRAGFEVAGIEVRGAAIDKVVVAQILESKQHPNADRLSVCQVDDGSGTPRQIVCGAKNYKVGDKVPLALPGAVMPGDFKIKVGKLRGVESEGMMCSAKELRLAEDSEGLLILPPDSVPGTPLSELFPPDTIVELEITPNRPDWLSHFGVARELAVFTDAPLKTPALPAPATAPAADAVKLSAAECPYYTLRRIRGVKVGPSPQWLQDRLAAVGLRAINNVVDVTNYVLFELGQPLHAFDAAKVNGDLTVRKAAEGETFAALDGRTYTLRPDFLTIADDTRVLALAGVMGGEDSGVTETTTDILLESAVFDPATVRRAVRSLWLASDSSYRFERGVDPEMVAAASARAAELILEIAGGTADEAVLEAGSHWARHEITLRHARARAILGAELSDATIEQSLARVGLEKLSGGTESSWAIPGFRRELSREADLIEEVVRVVGIESIPSRAEGLFSPASAADAAYDFVMEARRRLSGAGFHEARTSTLVSAAEAEWFGPAVALKNPFGEEQSRLRTSLLPGLITALRRNLDQGAKTICLFEAGRVFHPNGESQRFSLVAAGERDPLTWRGGKPRLWDVFDLKAVVASLVRIADEDLVPLAEPPAPFGAAFEIRVNGQRIGLAGQLHPAEVRRIGATGAVLAAEIDSAAWQAATPGLATTKPLAKFPASTRDIALVVPNDLAYGRVREVLESVADPLLAGISLFDVFTDPSGQKLAADKKSLAISLTFRSPERTLQSDEVSASTDRLRAALREKLGAEFRE